MRTAPPGRSVSVGRVTAALSTDHCMRGTHWSVTLVETRGAALVRAVRVVLVGGADELCATVCAITTLALGALIRECMRSVCTICTATPIAPSAIASPPRSVSALSVSLNLVAVSARYVPKSHAPWCCARCVSRRRRRTSPSRRRSPSRRGPSSRRRPSSRTAAGRVRPGRPRKPCTRACTHPA